MLCFIHFFLVTANRMLPQLLHTANASLNFLKQRKIMSNILITTWERMDGCDEQYRCSTELYRMSIMSQAFSVIINRSISAPGHGREVVDGLNSIEKRFLFQLMSTVQLSGGKRYDKQMFMHTGPYVQC